MIFNIVRKQRGNTEGKNRLNLDLVNGYTSQSLQYGNQVFNDNEQSGQSHIKRRDILWPYQF